MLSKPLQTSKTILCYKIFIDACTIYREWLNDILKQKQSYFPFRNNHSETGKLRMFFYDISDTTAYAFLVCTLGTETFTKPLRKNTFFIESSQLYMMGISA